MMTETKHFDFDRAMAFMGGKRKSARKMVDSFMSEYLPQHEKDIDQAIDEGNHDALFQAVHKLHGVLCYCGMPELESISEKLEEALKSHQSKRRVDNLCNRLLDEITSVKRAYRVYFFKEC